VFVYAPGGYCYLGKWLDDLKREMRTRPNRGRTILKMKIGSGPLEEDQKDLRRIEAMLEEVRH
jgi:hypothetical protein